MDNRTGKTEAWHPCSNSHYCILCFTVLAVLSLLGYQIWFSYLESIREAETKTRNYAAILETRLDATFRRTDAILQGLVNFIPVAALSQQAVPRYTRRLDAQLDAHMVNFQELAGLRVFDANGDLLYTWARASTPRTNIADRSHFRLLRDNPQAGLIFSKVITSRTTGRPSLVAARALQDAQGSFLGIVTAVVELDYFQKLFKALDTGHQGLITIRRSDDFSQVMRWPPMESENNKSLPKDHPARLVLNTSNSKATFEVAAATDGVVRIFSIHRLDRYPFYVQVALARDDVLASWRTRSLSFAGSGLLLLGLGAGVLLRLWRSECKMIQASSELVESEKSQRTSAERMAYLLTNSPVTIYTCKTSGDYGATFVSSNVKSQLGYAADEIIGNPGFWADRIHPDDRERVFTAIPDLFQHGHHNHEYRFLHQDGTYRWIHDELSLTRSVQGEPLEIIGYWVDITDRKLLEFNRDEDQRVMQDEILKNQKLESLGVLAGGIAHDFNNILTGIMGNISFAQLFLDATHNAYKPLAEAEKASFRAAELAQQLLTFARGGEPIKKVVSVHQIANESVSLVLSGTNVKGVIDIPDSIHAIEADEGQIIQVFNNIIINATHAMPGGGVLTVTAQNRTLGSANTLMLPEGNYVRVSFADEGCGISDDNLKRIFDPYFTTKSAGTGLGLASAHSIVSRHGGTISASSEVGRGTKFTLHLPSTGESFERHQADTLPQIAGHSAGGSVLVMDDEEMIRELATEMLGYLGYQITTCVDGEAAIQLYKAAMESGAPFSAVLLDLTIPGGMGGKEAAQRIREIDSAACLIVSSGYSNDQIIADYAAYGFRGVVAKPYKIDELGQVLGFLLASPKA